MQSFFDADVIDVELLYDNALHGVMLFSGKKFGLKYILSGTNHSTEGMKMPTRWNWYKKDALNILSIDRCYSKTPIKSYPLYSTLDYLIDTYLRRIKWISFLDYQNLTSFQLLKRLNHTMTISPIPISIMNLFLPDSIRVIFFLKNLMSISVFSISNLIITNQLTREQAVADISKYPIKFKRS